MNHNLDGNLASVECVRDLERIRLGQPTSPAFIDALSGQESLGGRAVRYIHRTVTEKRRPLIRLIVGEYGEGKTTFAGRVERVLANDPSVVVVRENLAVGRSISPKTLYHYVLAAPVIEAVVRALRDKPDIHRAILKRSFAPDFQPVLTLVSLAARQPGDMDNPDSDVRDACTAVHDALYQWYQDEVLTPVYDVLKAYGTGEGAPPRATRAPKGAAGVERFVSEGLRFIEQCGIYPVFIIDEYESAANGLSRGASGRDLLVDMTRSLVDQISTRSAGLFILTNEDGLELVRSYEALNQRLSGPETFALKSPQWPIRFFSKWDPDEALEVLVAAYESAQHEQDDLAVERPIREVIAEVDGTDSVVSDFYKQVLANTDVAPRDRLKTVIVEGFDVLVTDEDNAAYRKRIERIMRGNHHQVQHAVHTSEAETAREQPADYPDDGYSDGDESIAPAIDEADVKADIAALEDAYPLFEGEGCVFEDDYNAETDDTVERAAASTGRQAGPSMGLVTEIRARASVIGERMGQIRTAHKKRSSTGSQAPAWIPDDKEDDGLEPVDEIIVDENGIDDTENLEPMSPDDFPALCSDETRKAADKQFPDFLKGLIRPQAPFENRLIELIGSDYSKTFSGGERQAHQSLIEMLTTYKAGSAGQAGQNRSPAFLGAVIAGWCDTHPLPKQDFELSIAIDDNADLWSGEPTLIETDPITRMETDHKASESRYDLFADLREKVGNQVIELLETLRDERFFLPVARPKGRQKDRVDAEIRSLFEKRERNKRNPVYPFAWGLANPLADLRTARSFIYQYGMAAGVLFDDQWVDETLVKVLLEPITGKGLVRSRRGIRFHAPGSNQHAGVMTHLMSGKRIRYANAPLISDDQLNHPRVVCFSPMNDAHR